MSSATVTFACMKSWTESGRVRESSACRGSTSSARAQQRRPSTASAGCAPTGRRPGRSASRRRRPRRRAGPPPAPRSSVPRIGPAVSTGEAIRTRRRAAPIRLAMRCESSGPRPGQNHGRTLASPTAVEPRRSRRARPTFPRVPQLLEVARVGARRLARSRPSRARSPGPRPVVERPVHRAGPDRRAVAHRVLVVHQVAPARDPLQRHPELLEQRPARCSAAAARTAAAPPRARPG